MNPIQQHWQQPHHRGIPPALEVTGQEGFPGQGPYMQLALEMEGGAVRAAWFQTYNCPVAIACGSWLAQWLEGKTLEQARLLQIQDLEAMLGGLPPGKEHCSKLAMRTLNSALREMSSTVEVKEEKDHAQQ